MSIAAPVGDGSDDSYVRQKGRAFILALYSALRALKLYPAGHATVKKSLDDLAAVSNEFVATESELELKVTGEFIFVNGTRLRLDLDNYASFSHVLSVFRVCGIGELHASDAASSKDWQIFLANTQAPSDAPPNERLYDILEKMESAGVKSITLAEPPEESGEDREKSKERSKRTYAQSPRPRT